MNSIKIINKKIIDKLLCTLGHLEMKGSLINREIIFSIRHLQQKLLYQNLTAIHLISTQSIFLTIFKPGNQILGKPCTKFSSKVSSIFMQLFLTVISIKFFTIVINLNTMCLEACTLSSNTYTSTSILQASLLSLLKLLASIHHLRQFRQRL